MRLSPAVPDRPVLFAALFLVITLMATGCAQVPTSGPSSRQVVEGTGDSSALVQVIDVDAAVVRSLQASSKQRLFSESLGQGTPPGAPRLGVGDALEVHIFEAPPATLFGAPPTDPRALSSSRSVALPEQVIDEAGEVTVPFAGRIRAAGGTARDLELEIVRRLQGKANQPEVIVRRTRHVSSSVTVVGEVGSSLRMPLVTGSERVLDALAAAGGARESISRTALQITRGDAFHTLPLDVVIRDPRQNVLLRAGDVITAMVQPLSFTALGATGRNEEVSFELQGISLAQALARAGGLVDSRSDAQGVFVFRFESEDAMAWPRKPVVAMPDGRVPVVYRIDLRNPASFFAMQGFRVQNRDVLYVSNAPLAELQKFLNLVFSVTFPLVNVLQTGQD